MTEFFSDSNVDHIQDKLFELFTSTTKYFSKIIINCIQIQTKIKNKFLPLNVIMRYLIFYLFVSRTEQLTMRKYICIKFLLKFKLSFMLGYRSVNQTVENRNFLCTVDVSLANLSQLFSYKQKLNNNSIILVFS